MTETGDPDPATRVTPEELAEHAAQARSAYLAGQRMLRRSRQDAGGETDALAEELEGGLDRIADRTRLAEAWLSYFWITLTGTPSAMTAATTPVYGQARM
jgi:hypothetical protein